MILQKYIHAAVAVLIHDNKIFLNNVKDSPKRVSLGLIH